MRETWETIKQTLREYGEDRAHRLAAAIAYYTIFSIAPLLIIVIAVLGLVFGSEEARSQLLGGLQNRVGEESARLIETMIENTSRHGSGWIATLIGFVMLLVGASTVMVQLRGALNEIWDVPPEKLGGILHQLFGRLQGLALVLGLGFLLLVSFAIQTALNVILSNFSGTLPGGEIVWYLINLVITLALYTVAFAGLFKVLPDVDLAWRHVWRGGLLTAVLFKIGEVLIGFYLSLSGVRSTYGAAGSLVVLLLWIFFSSQITLLGAEFTQVSTRRSKEMPVASEATGNAEV